MPNKLVCNINNIFQLFSELFFLQGYIFTTATIFHDVLYFLGIKVKSFLYDNEFYYFNSLVLSQGGDMYLPISEELLFLKGN